MPLAAGGITDVNVQRKGGGLYGEVQGIMGNSHMGQTGTNTYDQKHYLPAIWLSRGNDSRSVVVGDQLLHVFNQCPLLVAR